MIIVVVVAAVELVGTGFVVSCAHHQQQGDYFLTSLTSCVFVCSVCVTDVLARDVDMEPANPAPEAIRALYDVSWQDAQPYRSWVAISRYLDLTPRTKKDNVLFHQICQDSNCIAGFKVEREPLGIQALYSMSAERLGTHNTFVLRCGWQSLAAVAAVLNQQMLIAIPSSKTAQLRKQAVWVSRMVTCSYKAVPYRAGYRADGLDDLKLKPLPAAFQGCCFGLARQPITAVACASDGRMNSVRCPRAQ